jgi:hypothetical protein
VARQWSLVKPNGEKWEALKKELIELDLTLDPTMTIYAAGRNVMYARNADWHDIYTLPSQWIITLPADVHMDHTGLTGLHMMRSPGKNSTKCGCNS